MVNEAQQYASEDQRKRAEAETRNQADSLVYTTEKLLSEHGDKVPEDLKQEVQTNIGALRSAIEQNDVAAMQTAMNTLNASVERLGQAVYSQTGAGSQAGSPPGGTAGDQPEGTVEGEYREL
jgi:molecular chaperone DnaK